VTGLASGGVIPGYAPGHYSVPAMLSPGEGVLVPEAVRALGGAAAIDQLNRLYSRGRVGGDTSVQGLPALPGAVGQVQGAAAPAAHVTQNV